MKKLMVVLLIVVLTLSFGLASCVDEGDFNESDLSFYVDKNINTLVYKYAKDNGYSKKEVKPYLSHIKNYVHTFDKKTLLSKQKDIFSSSYDQKLFSLLTSFEYDVLSTWLDLSVTNDNSGLTNILSVFYTTKPTLLVNHLRQNGYSLSSTLYTIDNFVFSEIDKTTFAIVEKTVSENDLTLDKNKHILFEVNSKVSDLILPKKITYITNDCFNNSNNLTKITLHNNIKYIEFGAFNLLDNLTIYCDFAPNQTPSTWLENWHGNNTVVYKK